MATLTEFAYHTRKFVKYGGAALIFIIVGRLILNMAINLWKQLHPPPPPPPTVAFGKLPALTFPVSDYDGLFKYQVETPNQKLPVFPDRATIYFMPSIQANLLALDKAKQKAVLLGFTQAPQPFKDEEVYRWVKNEVAARILEMNIISGTFTLTYSWENDPTILSQKNLPGEEQAKIEISNFLQKAGLYEEDLQLGEKKVSYLKTSGRKLLPAVSLSEANFVQVEMFRADIEELPVLTPDPSKGIISFTLSGAADSQRKIVSVDYNYFPVKYDSFATYPIKTAATALEQLKSGQGFIASWNKSENRTIIIRRVYLAYLDIKQPQKFLQPIIVFQGDDNFTAYVPAVTSQWVN